MTESRRHAAIPPADTCVEIVTEHFQPDPQGFLVDKPTLASLRRKLVWDQHVNMAVIPVADPENPESDLIQIFAAHATHATGAAFERMEPRLRFDDIPVDQRARTKSVYGNGIYVANRPEVSWTVEAQQSDKTLVAFLTDPVKRSEILDRRRSTVAKEVGHLVGMVGTEVIMPKLIGAEETARRFAEKANAEWEEQGAKVVLLNEAPRRRSEKLPHETRWAYDTVSPQYALLRTPVQRIGTFRPPQEKARRHNPAVMYGGLFWLSAIKNARDAKRIGAPHDFTSRG
jgi:hypothetical protein